MSSSNRFTAYIPPPRETADRPYVERKEYIPFERHPPQTPKKPTKSEIRAEKIKENATKTRNFIYHLQNKTMPTAPVTKLRPEKKSLSKAKSTGKRKLLINNKNQRVDFYLKLKR